MSDFEDSRVVVVSSADHGKSLVKALRDLFDSKRGADFDLHWQGKSVKAHKLILELFLASDVIRPRSDGQYVPEFGDRRGRSHLDSVLEFLYKGEVSVLEEELEGLLKIAKDLDFKLLVDAALSAKGHVAETTNVRSSRAKKSSPILKKSVRLSRVNTRRTSVTTFSTPMSVMKDNCDSSAGTPNSEEIMMSVEESVKGTERSGVIGTDQLFHSDTENRSTVISESGHSSADWKSSSNTRRGQRKTKKMRTGTAGAMGICLKRHGPQLFKCQHCDYETRSKISFHVHQAKHDSSVEVFRCTSCNRPFFCRDSLERHSSLHANEATRKCSYCTYQTLKLPNLYQHLYSKHSVNARGEPIEAKFKCPDCSFVCSIASKLRIHREKHSTAKNFRCEQCTFAAKRKGDLVQHVRVVHLDIKRYQCELCGYRSPHISVLELHRRTHTGERPFKCGTCDKAFSDPAAFSRHVRLHGANDKSFICHVCAFRFNRRGNLRAHLKNVHKIQMDPDSGVARARRSRTPKLLDPS